MKPARLQPLHTIRTVTAIETALAGRLRYTSPERSFSPLFSNAGLGFDGKSGIASIYLHYNRITYAWGSPFIKTETEIADETMAPLDVRQTLRNGGETRAAFYARDAWIFSARGSGRVTLDFGPDIAAARPDLTRISPRIWLLCAHIPTQESRDPDTHFPLRIAIRVIAGTLTLRKTTLPGSPAAFTVEPDARGRVILAFALAVLDINVDALFETLQQAPRSADAALDSSRIWLKDTLHRLPLPAPDHPTFPVAARAALSLAMNAAEAPGQLRDRVTVFPNRGNYACSFLWDSCFQNLATEQMVPRFAPDSLLVLTDNLRADGMMPTFLCSTWRRPYTSQPPLVGWAAARLVQQRRDPKLAAHFLDALTRNNAWWVTQRGTSDGLIICRDPMETGWDNTPRMDCGPIIALDMSSYVLTQHRTCAMLAAFLGRKAEAADWKRKAARMARALVARCYDEKSNLFRDVLLATGEQLSIKTPAAFLPLWAGVPLPAARRRAMIRDWLLNPKYFFNSVPFPSVSYDDPSYQAAQYWRGPSWSSVNYLLLELLAQEGMHAERAVARDRFIELWLKDGDLRELFDSQTGAGLGSQELGWTAAVFLKLLAEQADAT